ncbi:hypothetical protein HLH14_09310 [Acinetobacter sp. ANC 4282]|uniref:holin n=1 Tax=Acinetobacter terrae TaxID=2731247 RepID=UPI0014903D4C|nr:holin [Acinetobacter terrae]NNH16190.1 hypothetical protein [Acinetobacter terrae]
MADRAHLTAETAAVISDVASKTTYIGGLGGFFAWILSIDILPWAGLFVAMAGLIVNWYYRRQENKRAQEIHDLTVKRLRED